MHRGFAALICGTAFVSLGAQFLVSEALMGAPGLGAVLWRMAGYFTVLTNILVAVTFLSVVATGQRVGPIWAGGLTLWIAAVGIVYHLVLAGLWRPEGLAWWADQGLHTAVPLLVVLWWGWQADKSGLRRRHAGLWLLWPALYCAYAVIRGALSGFYPYPFLDVAALGPGAVAVNVVGLLLAFVGGGLMLLALARWRAGVRAR
ncbi:Pr6Pr family membrane protein [Roseovarius sp.]|uniref:Pr6Pr family membrane protein n=1 Tax=Roseovarius sp. TaxID=1486281 RepID=UPI000C4F7F9E|nr:Pr6Pr family membrane protein [Roseovarius sp.]MAZ20349.1 hypothetical protein [Roseovarius sp.]